MTGRIARVFVAGGFAFLSPDDPPAREVYLHWTQLVGASLRDLHVGQPVAFELAPDRAGRVRAVDVRLLDDAAAEAPW